MPNLLASRILSVTTTMDSARERVTLSMISSSLKKTSVQVKPGKKKTSISPSIALMMGTCSKNGKIKPKKALIGDSQSIPCVPLYRYCTQVVYDLI